MKIGKKIFAVLFIAVAALFVAVFAQRNEGIVNIDLLFHTFSEVPLWLVLLFAFLIGIIFSTLLLAWDLTKIHASLATTKRVNKKLKKKIAILSKESHSEEESTDEEDDDDELHDDGE
ncbi:LapA family protein [bacterium]|nr:LapA family protein [bacterium]